mgnify:CR=1 FL=1
MGYFSQSRKVYQICIYPQFGYERVYKHYEEIYQEHRERETRIRYRLSFKDIKEREPTKKCCNSLFFFKLNVEPINSTVNKNKADLGEKCDDKS